MKGSRLALAKDDRDKKNGHFNKAESTGSSKRPARCSIREWRSASQETDVTIQKRGSDVTWKTTQRDGKVTGDGTVIVLALCRSGHESQHRGCLQAWKGGSGA